MNKKVEIGTGLRKQTVLEGSVTLNRMEVWALFIDYGRIHPDEMLRLFEIVESEAVI